MQKLTIYLALAVVCVLVLVLGVALYFTMDLKEVSIALMAVGAASLLLVGGHAKKSTRTEYVQVSNNNVDIQYVSNEIENLDKMIRGAGLPPYAQPANAKEHAVMQRAYQDYVNDKKDYSHLTLILPRLAQYATEDPNNARLTYLLGKAHKLYIHAATERVTALLRLRTLQSYSKLSVGMYEFIPNPVQPSEIAELQTIESAMRDILRRAESDSSSVAEFNTLYDSARVAFAKLQITIHEYDIVPM